MKPNYEHRDEDVQAQKSLIKERPMPFTRNMVAAILDGVKTHTRRVISPQPTWQPEWAGIPGGYAALEAKCLNRQHPWEYYCISSKMVSQRALDCYSHKDAPKDAEFIACPYGVPGQRIWVREACMNVGFLGDVEYPDGLWIYKADFDAVGIQQLASQYEDFKWTQARYMPRLASRIILEIQDIRWQHIQDITPDACMMEGIEFADDMGLLLTHGPVKAYEHLWDSLYAGTEKAWANNPLVWDIEFKKIEP